LSDHALTDELGLKLGRLAPIYGISTSDSAPLSQRQAARLSTMIPRLRPSREWFLRNLWSAGGDGLRPSRATRTVTVELELSESIS